MASLADLFVFRLLQSVIKIPNAYYVAVDRHVPDDYPVTKCQGKDFLLVDGSRYYGYYCLERMLYYLPRTYESGMKIVLVGDKAHLFLDLLRRVVEEDEEKVKTLMTAINEAVVGTRQVVDLDDGRILYSVFRESPLKGYVFYLLTKWKPIEPVVVLAILYKFENRYYMLEGSDKGVSELIAKMFT